METVERPTIEIPGELRFAPAQKRAFQTTERTWSALAIMRFLLALVVVCRHMDVIGYDLLPPIKIGESFGGYCAVICFLMISGFSMAHSLSRAPDPEGFYKRRFWRIMPTYLAALMIAWVLGRTVFSIQNLTNLACQALMLQTILVGALNNLTPAWSLASEWWLYVAAPWLKTDKIVVCLLLVSLGFCALHLALGIDRLSSQVGLWCLLMLSAPWLAGFAYYRIRKPIFLVGPGLAMLLTQNFDASSGHRFLWLYGACCLAMMFAERFDVSSIGKKVCAFFGDLSYPLYLVHYPIMVFLQSTKYSPYALSYVMAGALIILMIIDRPCRKHYKRRLPLWMSQMMNLNRSYSLGTAEITSTAADLSGTYERLDQSVVPQGELAYGQPRERVP